MTPPPVSGTGASQTGGGVTFTARDLVHANNARLLLGNPHTTFEGISIDTRTIRKGDLFFAISGPHHDGHDHLEEAVKKGAVGIVVQTLDDRVRFDPEQVPTLFQVPNSISAL